MNDNTRSGATALVPRKAPYSNSALAYANDGISPLPANGKHVLVKGHHGLEGKPVPARLAREWSRRYGRKNIAGRLPPWLVAFDVDDYEGHDGARTLADLEAELGPLPLTTLSTARWNGAGPRGANGIRWFRLPEGYQDRSWPGEAGPGIEIVWHCNRYVMVPPSWHDDIDAEYRWYNQDGGSELVWPEFSELPELPKAWCDRFCGARSASPRLAVDDRQAWLDERVTEGEPCEGIAETLDKWLRSVSEAGSAGGIHSAGLGGVKAIIGDSIGGHFGGWAALGALESAFLKARYGRAGERKRKADAEHEWRSMVHSAAGESGLARRKIVDEDPCEVLGGELVDPRVQMREDFWNSSRRLRLIRAWAQARMVSPMAALGEVLAEVVCHVPPYVQLPPIVGGNGTLNMLIALTGYSGTGKGVAAGVVAEAIECNVSMDMQRIPIGSGEGIPKAFGRVNHNRDTGLYELVRTFHSAVIEVKEIDTLSAIGSRVGGHTLTAQLNQFYSGEQLGFHYSDMKNRVIIPARSYRGCVVAGVQPGRGAVILDDTDSGFAQRWLWLPATDPDAPAEAPAVPGQTIKWSLPEDLLPEDFPWRPEPFIMDVCDKAVDQIRAARLPALRGETDGLDGHKLYTRLKVAAALALLEGYADVDEMDWDRAGYLIRISDSVRRRAEEELKRNAMKAAHVQGKMEGIRTSVAGDTAHKIAIERIGRKVMEIMPASDEWVSFGNGIKNKIAARDREMLPEAMANLVKTKKLEARNVTYRGQTGVQYRVATK